MTISYAQLPRYLDKIRFPVEVYRDKSTEIDAICTREDLEALIGGKYAYAYGTPSKVKQIFTIRPLQDVLDEMRRGQLSIVAERERAPMDLLMRMVFSRKFTYRERIDVFRNGGLSVCFIHQHRGVRLR